MPYLRWADWLAHVTSGNVNTGIVWLSRKAKIVETAKDYTFWELQEKWINTQNKKGFQTDEPLGVVLYWWTHGTQLSVPLRYRQKVNSCAPLTWPAWLIEWRNHRHTPRKAEIGCAVLSHGDTAQPRNSTLTVGHGGGELVVHSWTRRKVYYTHIRRQASSSW